MKLLIVFAVLTICGCVSADISHLYLPAQQSFGSGQQLGNSKSKFGNAQLGNIQPKFGNGQSPFESSQFSSGDQSSFSGSHFRSQAADEKNAAILKFVNDVTNEGFHYNYETENGIRAEESGNSGGSKGTFSYKGDDGQTYTVTFVAGDGGFQAQGAHLPTAPPIPEEILMSLQQNAKDEAAGIFNDGQYRAENEGGEQYQDPNSQNFKGNLQSSSFSVGSSSHKQSFDEKTGYQY